MTAPKAIPFEQVRVRTDFDGAHTGPRTAVRSFIPARQAATFQWSRLDQTESERDSAPEYAEEDDPLGNGLTATERQLLNSQQEFQPGGGQDHAKRQLLATPEREPVQGDLAPAHPPEGFPSAGTQRTNRMPITAIAKSVRQAAVLSHLTETIKGLCDGEESQRLGPWDMTLPLDTHGLGQTMLNLRLSHGELLLRFRCDDSDVLDLLSKGADRLTSQLQESLHPRLDVRVELAL